VAFIEAPKEIAWIGKISEGLQEKQVNSTPLRLENNFGIKLAKNPKF